MLSFLRAIKFALEDMVRNASLSLMTILILILMLLSVNTLLTIQVLTNQAIVSVKDQIDLSIFFDPEASEKQIADIRTHVASFPEVTGITLLSRDEVLTKFKEDHKDNTDILASLEELGTNPLGATLVVKARDPQDFEKIIAGLQVPEYEDIIVAKTFADTEKAIDRIHVITTRVEQFSISLTILFAIIAFLIIFNTIRVAIYTQRVEIAIKKLVGATNWFVRGPYLIEAVIFSIIATGVTTLLIFVGARLLDPYITAVFGAQAFLTRSLTSHILLLTLGQFGVVLFLTALTSILAMRKYLRA